MVLDGEPLTSMPLTERCILTSDFTALHAMQTLSSGENSVCPSVRLSVCHTRGL